MAGVKRFCLKRAGRGLWRSAATMAGSVRVKELALDGMDVRTALSVLQSKYNADEYHLTLPPDMACPFPLERVAAGVTCWYDAAARERVFEHPGRAPYISLVLD